MAVAEYLVGKIARVALVLGISSGVGGRGGLLELIQKHFRRRRSRFLVAPKWRTCAATPLRQSKGNGPGSDWSMGRGYTRATDEWEVRMRATTLRSLSSATPSTRMWFTLLSRAFIFENHWKWGIDVPGAEASRGVRFHRITIVTRVFFLVFCSADSSHTSETATCWKCVGGSDRSWTRRCRRMCAACAPCSAPGANPCSDGKKVMTRPSNGLFRSHEKFS